MHAPPQPMDTAARAVEAVDTPFVLIDARVVQANLQRAADYVASHGLGLRPHTKTHKMLRLARRQMDCNAVGLTVAKPGEASVMAQVTDDLLLAYPIVVETAARKLALLAANHTMRTIADTLAGVKCLERAARQAGTRLGVLVDLDLGMGRTGVPDAQTALELAQAIDRSANLQLDGLFVYPGQVWAPPEDQPPVLRQMNAQIESVLALWTEHGLAAPIVSGGSTPTLYQSHEMPALTEIRPGTYVFNDRNSLAGGFCSLEQCAARVVSTVVSNAVNNRAVLDAGSKTLTGDRLIPGHKQGHGLVVEFPDATLDALSEEHGHLNIEACGTPPKLGQRVTVVPNHICPCINLHDRIWWTQDGCTAEPVTVAARGCVW